MSILVDWFRSGFSDPQRTVAQIIGFLPMILSFFTFRQNSRKRIIFFKACSDALSALHYFLLREFTGGAVNVVCILRSLIFSQKDKRWARSNWIPVIFCIFTLLCAIPDFEGAKNLFATVGSCLAIVGFWQNDIKKLRYFNLAGVSLWLIYGIWAVSVSTILHNLITIISILSTLVKERKSKAPA